MNLRYNGQPVSWFGMGESDPSSGCGQCLLGVGAPDAGAGIATLRNALTRFSGEGGFSPPPPTVAVSGLKAAGTAAVNAVGPVIDALSGGNPDVMKLTHSAWDQNRQLASVGPEDVDTAKKIVSQMIFSYMQASNLAAPKTAVDEPQGTATSRVNIPAPSPGRAPAPRSSSQAPPATPAPAAPPAAPPDADSPWLVPAIVAGGVVLLGGVLVVVARQRAA